MNWETQSISLILGLATFFLAVIILFHYRRDSVFISFKWWAIGFSLLAVRYLLPGIQEMITVWWLFNILEQWLLVASALMIFIGINQFIGNGLIRLRLIIFVSAFIIITSGFFLLNNYVIPAALSMISVSVVSVLISWSLVLKKPAINKNLYKIFRLTFFLHAFFFFLHGVILLVPLSSIGFDHHLFFNWLSQIFIFFFALIWSLTFIFLVNERFKITAVQNKAIYDLTINTIPDAVFITRLKDGLILKVNDGFEHLSGFSADEVIGKTTLDLNIWDNPADRQKLITLLADSGYVENLEFKFNRKNGKTLIGLISSRTVILQEKPHIVSVIRDYTSRKKMEEKLRENEENYRFLAENSADVIWHINKNYHIDYVSPADEAIRGFRREEVIGQPIWNIFKPEGIKLIREKIDHHKDTEQVGNNARITQFEIEQRCKNGGWIWTEIKAAPHYEKNGNFIGYHGISRDISERKKLIERLNQLAKIDDLTGIPNRRYFTELAEKELIRAKRYHHPLSLIIIDFDDLKKVNDTYGHLAGDRALVVFSKIVQALIRDVDIVGRFGGDEFLILLPETDRHKAEFVIDRIQQILTASPVIFQEEQFYISISAGVTALEEWTDSLADLINRADENLYQMKRSQEKNSASLDDYDLRSNQTY